MSGTQVDQRAYVELLRQTLPTVIHSEEQNDLKQKDLLDVFGTGGIVSEGINGKREFSKGHIRRLAKRFHVSPELVF